MLGQPRVVGRRVEREVERHVHAVLARGVAQRAQVVDRPQLRVDRLVAALLGPDRVRHAGIVGPGHQRVVAALAVLAADRVDGREVEDVEAVVGDRRDLRLDAREAAPRAREQLVPGREAPADAVDLERQRLLERRRLVPQVDALDRLGEVGAHRRLVMLGLGELRVPHGGHRRLDRLAIGGVLGGAGGLLEQRDALGQLALEVVLPRVDLAMHLVAPRGEEVVPGLDRELPATGGLDRELTLPADAAVVRVDRTHGRFEPALAAGRLVAHDRAQHLVAVAEDVGRDVHGVAHGPLGWVPSCVDGGRGLVDLGPRRCFGAHGLGHRSREVSTTRAL